MSGEIDALFDTALKVRERAYAPYSRYKVGAAILDESGNVAFGCNIENRSAPEGICAEANAIGAMIANGGKKIRSIVILGGGVQLTTCTPCGGCRQRIAEFADDETRIYVGASKVNLECFVVVELLPRAY